MNVNERVALIIVSALIAAAVSMFIARSAERSSPGLSLSTMLLTASLLLFYYFYVADPAHGIAILILPLATGWLWWRRRQTGKPSLSSIAFAGFQLLFACLYVVLVWLQER